MTTQPPDESENRRRLNDLDRPSDRPVTPTSPPASGAPVRNQEALAALDVTVNEVPPPVALSPRAPASALPPVPPPVGVPATVSGTPRSTVGRGVVVGAASAATAVLLVIVTALVVRATSATAPTVPSAPVAVGTSDVFPPPDNVGALIATVKASTMTVYCGVPLGSAFVLDGQTLGANAPSTLIVTNRHVVEPCLDGTGLTIVVSGAEASAQVIGEDAANDLALLSADIQVPALDAAGDPEIGQWVMAVGTPLGVENSVTFGNISNVIPAKSLITTDAAISPGSSGGPLVDNAGRVLGINSEVMGADYGSSIGLSRTVSQLCAQLVDCR